MLLHASSEEGETLSRHDTLAQFSRYEEGIRRRHERRQSGPGRQHLQGARFKMTQPSEEPRKKLQEKNVLQTENSLSTGASRFRAASWRRGPFEEGLLGFPASVVKALGVFKPLHDWLS